MIFLWTYLSLNMTGAIKMWGLRGGGTYRKHHHARNNYKFWSGNLVETDHFRYKADGKIKLSEM
jgi:hypothetical protein